MSSNIETEARIRLRADKYPAAARTDIDALLAETARLREAVSEEYAQRTAAERLSASQLVEATKAKAKVRELAGIIARQSEEIAEQQTAIRSLRETLAGTR
jgi:hypothetical protein